MAISIRIRYIALFPCVSQLDPSLALHLELESGSNYLLCERNSHHRMRVLLVSLGPLRNFESLPPVRLTAIFVFLNHSCSFPSRKEDRERDGSPFADRPLSLLDFPVFFAFVKTVFSRLKRLLKLFVQVESEIAECKFQK